MRKSISLSLLLSAVLLFNDLKVSATTTTSNISSSLSAIQIVNNGGRITAQDAVTNAEVIKLLETGSNPVHLPTSDKTAQAKWVFLQKVLGDLASRTEPKYQFVLKNVMRDHRLSSHGTGKSYFNTDDQSSIANIIDAVVTNPDYFVFRKSIDCELELGPSVT